MGKELEYKLLIDSEETLRQVLADPLVASLVAEPWQKTQMKTTYFDTSDRRFSAHGFTLRRRLEGERSVVCLKTPLAQSHARGEWQICAERIDENAIAQLLAQGAPTELLAFYGSGEIHPVCGAEFLREHVVLRFADGSRAEIAGDRGILHGQTERLPFTELELELLEGEADEMLTLVHFLCNRYALHEQPLSKYARARKLK